MAASAAWPGAETATVALFLAVILAAVALGIIGAVVHGLLFLLAVGCVVFVADLVFLGTVLRGRRHRPAR